MNANLEIDIMSNANIVSKCKKSNKYANELYSALCNNLFFYSDKQWSCSWRYAGSIIATIVGDGDYLTYYCNGNEGTVTEEIAIDLFKLGWPVRAYRDEDF